jgi:3-oxoacyl-(acyl-carrier-protein) synthase
LGLVTPLACGVEETWSRLIASKSGARKLEGFETSDLATKIGCQVPRGDGSNPQNLDLSVSRDDYCPAIVIGKC